MRQTGEPRRTYFRFLAICIAGQGLVTDVDEYARRRSEIGIRRAVLLRPCGWALVDEMRHRICSGRAATSGRARRRVQTDGGILCLAAMGFKRGQQSSTIWDRDDGWPMGKWVSPRFGGHEDPPQCDEKGLGSIPLCPQRLGRCGQKHASPCPLDCGVTSLSDRACRYMCMSNSRRGSKHCVRCLLVCWIAT